MLLGGAATSRPSAAIESELVQLSYLKRINIRLMDGQSIIVGSMI